jgi:hypothetical protein
MTTDYAQRLELKLVSPSAVAAELKNGLLCPTRSRAQHQRVYFSAFSGLPSGAPVRADMCS